MLLVDDVAVRHRRGGEDAVRLTQGPLAGWLSKLLNHMFLVTGLHDARWLHEVSDALFLASELFDLEVLGVIYVFELLEGLALVHKFLQVLILLQPVVVVSPGHGSGRCVNCVQSGSG